MELTVKSKNMASSHVAFATSPSRSSAVVDLKTHEKEVREELEQTIAASTTYRSSDSAVQVLKKWLGLESKVPTK